MFSKKNSIQEDMIIRSGIFPNPLRSDAEQVLNSTDNIRINRFHSITSHRRISTGFVIYLEHAAQRLHGPQVRYNSFNLSSSSSISCKIFLFSAWKRLREFSLKSTKDKSFFLNSSVKVNFNRNSLILSYFFQISSTSK